MASRNALHAMLDEVPEELLPLAEVSLVRLGRMGTDPFWRSLACAAESNEPLSATDVEAIAAGWESLAHHRGVADEDLEHLLA